MHLDIILFKWYWRGAIVFNEFDFRSSDLERLSETGSKYPLRSLGKYMIYMYMAHITYTKLCQAIFRDVLWLNELLLDGYWKIKWQTLFLYFNWHLFSFVTGLISHRIEFEGLKLTLHLHRQPGMAPFKLKFRMGSSRSTSQDTDTESSASSHHQNLSNQLNGAQQPLLHAQHRSPTNSAAGISTTTLDSIDFPSLNANEQRNLLPSNSNNSVSNHSKDHQLVSTKVASRF